MYEEIDIPYRTDITSMGLGRYFSIISLTIAVPILILVSIMMFISHDIEGFVISSVNAVFFYTYGFYHLVSNYGREKIIIQGKLFTYRVKYNTLSITKKIPIEEIHSICIEDYVLFIKYGKNKKINIGRNLTQQDLSVLKDFLRSFLPKKFNWQRS